MCKYCNIYENTSSPTLPNIIGGTAYVRRDKGFDYSIVVKTTEEAAPICIPTIACPHCGQELEED